MMTIALPLLLLYGLFLYWYGGNGKPMSADESAALLNELAARAGDDLGRGHLDEVRALLVNDDGREFVMQNLVRYRPRALYPPGYDYNDDPRAADKRYGKAIFLHLLRYGNVILFVAPRRGNFIEPEGADAWHYVAMVRYRSRRDFLRFALATEKGDIFVHKWAAIEKTHVFPVQPLISLFFVRGTVAVLLALTGLVLHLLLR
jgi:hypothetical protein